MCAIYNSVWHSVKSLKVSAYIESGAMIPEQIWQEGDKNWADPQNWPQLHGHFIQFKSIYMTLIG